MRAMMISLFIVTFCLTWNSMLQFNELIYAATTPHVYLFPQVGMYSTLNNITNLQSVSEYQDSMKGIISPMQQLEASDTGDIGFMGWVTGGASFLYNTFLYSTVNFDVFARKNLFVPDFLASLMRILVMATHVIGMIEFVSGRVLGGMSR